MRCAPRKRSVSRRSRVLPAPSGARAHRRSSAGGRSPPSSRVRRRGGSSLATQLVPPSRMSGCAPQKRRMHASARRRGALKAELDASSRRHQTRAEVGVTVGQVNQAARRRLARVHSQRKSARPRSSKSCCAMANARAAAAARTADAEPSQRKWRARQARSNA